MCILLRVRADEVSLQPYLDQAVADKARAEKEKDEYDVRISRT